MYKKLAIGAAAIAGLVLIIYCISYFGGSVDWTAVDAWFAKSLTDATVGDIFIIGLCSATLAGIMAN